MWATALGTVSCNEQSTIIFIKPFIIFMHPFYLCIGLYKRNNLNVFLKWIWVVFLRVQLLDYAMFIYVSACRAARCFRFSDREQLAERSQATSLVSDFPVQNRTQCLFTSYSYLRLVDPLRFNEVWKKCLLPFEMSVVFHIWMIYCATPEHSRTMLKGW